ncbi:hypothetical protein Y032_0358g3402 [Ancylostoma ceylanicum]|uniref:Uncharacterized protein n=1 Tax=Ancylostoma ceylanicum TaxID=53326 RepID=A0A016RW08_9BILA|nr:hypothetical protein Y032_0358g3402 [Ancylostoma ceylanicum]
MIPMLISLDSTAKTRTGLPLERKCSLFCRTAKRPLSRRNTTNPVVAVVPPLYNGCHYPTVDCEKKNKIEKRVQKRLETRATIW